MPFEIVRNDITRMNTDAIVNAANRTLLGGGGVDGAIHRAAGPELLEECRTLNGCQTGEAKITRGYRLPARYVIHTVGPVWHGGGSGEKDLLSSCYRNSLRLALENHCESVAFPLISSGAYGYPPDQAMAVAVDVISRFLLEHDMMVYLVVFGPKPFQNSKKLFRDVQEYVDDVYVAEHSHPRLSHSRRRMWQGDEYAARELDLRLSKADLRVAENALESIPEPARKCASVSSAPAPGPDLEELLKQTDESFSQTLLRMIAERGWTDAQCYKKANVDRKLFSKIRTNPEYKPSKPTVFAFAVALELSLPETQSLLHRAGFALSHSSKFDIVLEYFIRHRLYNIYEINETLFDFDLPLLGSSAG